MRTRADRYRQKLWPALYMLGFFHLVRVQVSVLNGTAFYLIVLGSIGLLVMTGFLIYARAPRQVI